MLLSRISLWLTPSSPIPSVEAMFVDHLSAGLELPSTTRHRPLSNFGRIEATLSENMSHYRSYSHHTSESYLAASGETPRVSGPTVSHLYSARDSFDPGDYSRGCLRHFAAPVRPEQCGCNPYRRTHELDVHKRAASIPCITPTGVNLQPFAFHVCMKVSAFSLVSLTLLFLSYSDSGVRFPSSSTISRRGIWSTLAPRSNSYSS